MRLPRNLKVFRGQLEAAPFLSVLLLLLILLTLAPKLVFDPGVPIALDLPAANVPGITNDTLSVAIDSSGLYYYDGQLTPLPQLLETLLAAVAGSPAPLALRIYADATGRLDATEQLFAQAPKLGFEKVFLVYKPLPGPDTSRLPSNPAAPGPRGQR